MAARAVLAPGVQLLTTTCSVVSSSSRAFEMAVAARRYPSCVGSCLKQPIPGGVNRSPTMSQTCRAPSNLNELVRSAGTHSAIVPICDLIKGRKLGKLAAAGSRTWKIAAAVQHTAVRTSTSVPPHTCPMTDHLLVLEGKEGDARQEINQAGGHILHWFGDGCFVATLGQGVDVNSLTNASPLPRAYEASASTLSLIQAWRDSHENNIRSHKDVGALWNAPGKTPPGGSGKVQRPAGSLASSLIKTGTKYLAGKIGLILVVVSGPGRAAITDDEIANAQAQIVTGAEFWAKAEPLANIEFIHNIEAAHLTVPYQDLPDGRPYTDYENVFLGPALQAIGYQGIDQLLNHIFPDQDTWGYCVFVTRYKLGWSGYAYPGTNRMFMNYDNDGWGPQNLGRSFAHETGHIFNALDEYAPQCDCNADPYAKVPGIINGNCETCSTRPSVCIMKSNDLTHICPYTRGQLGWEWWGYSTLLGEQTDQSPAITSNGTKLYLAFEATDQTGVYIRSSTDHGTTWRPKTAVHEVTTPGTGPALACFNGMLYMAFASGPEGKIMVKRSRDDGTTWAEPAVDTGESCGGCKPSIAILDGTLYVAFRVTDGTQRVGLISSTDGTTWANSIRLDMYRTPQAPALCCLDSVSGSNLFLAFATTNSPHQYIQVVTSTDGETFGSPVVLQNAYSRGQGPALGAHNGRMYLVYAADLDGKPLAYLSSGPGNSWTPFRLTPGPDSTDSTPSLVADGAGGLRMTFKGNGNQSVNILKMGGAVAY